MRRFRLISIVVIASYMLMMGNALAGDLQLYMKRGHKSPKWTPLVEAGFSAFESNNYDAGINFFKRAIGKGCKDGLVYFKLGILYEDREDLATALGYLKQASIYLPKRYRSTTAAKTIRERLGTVLFSLGDIAAAKAEFQKALKYQGANFTVLFLLGSIARQEGDDEKMVDYYSRALTFPPPEGTNPSNILLTLLIETGKGYFNLHQYDRSLAIWNKVLEIAPNHPIARQFKDNIERKKMGKAMEGQEQRIIDRIIK